MGAQRTDTAEAEARRVVDELAEQAYQLRFVELRRASELAGQALAQAERIRHTAGIARALVAGGAAHCRLLELAAAEAALNRARGIFRDHPDLVGDARALTWLGAVSMRRVAYDECMPGWSEALAKFRSANDLAGEGDVLHMVGLLLSKMGDTVAGLEALEGSRAIKEQLGDHHGLALCTSDVAITFMEFGDHESGRRHIEEVLDYYRQTGAVSALISNLINHGNACTASGDFALALRSLEECLELIRTHDEGWAEPPALHNVAEVFYGMGEYDTAMAHLTAGRSSAQAVGDRAAEVGIQLTTGRILLRQDRFADALEQIHDALAVASGAGMQRFVAEGHQLLTHAYETAGDHRLALHHLKAFLEVQENRRREGDELRVRYRSELSALRRQQEETELQVLKAQLQPHFLLNALHLVSALVRSRPEEGTRAIVQLSKLLRLALEQSSDQTTTLRDELRFLRAYLDLELLRHGPFQYSVEIEPGLERASLPHMLLQPIAENAVRHGLSRAPGKLHLEIRAERTSDPGFIRLTVRDTGGGLPDGWSPDSTGVGLGVTRQRLQRLYGHSHTFSIGPAPGGGVLVAIVLPVDAASREDCAAAARPRVAEPRRPPADEG